MSATIQIQESVNDIAVSTTTYSVNITNGGAFTAALEDLTDVSVPGVTDGEYLAYQASTKKWIATASSGNGIVRTVSSVSTNTAAGASLLTDYVYLCSGTMTITLPTAVGNKNLYSIKNTGVGTITIATTSSQTMDGSATITLNVQNTSLDFVSDGTNWRIL